MVAARRWIYMTGSRVLTYRVLAFGRRLWRGLYVHCFLLFDMLIGYVSTVAVIIGRILLLPCR